jgi:hypothetical protein
MVWILVTRHSVAPVVGGVNAPPTAEGSGIGGKAGVF